MYAQQLSPISVMPSGQNSLRLERGIGQMIQSRAKEVNDGLR
jgi:hypothetical protein